MFEVPRGALHSRPQLLALCLLSCGALGLATTQGGSYRGRDPRPPDSVITVGKDRPVAINARGLATIEPHLVADPRDPNHLLSGVFLVSKLGDPRNPNFEMDIGCAALASFDAGQTWMRHDFAAKRCIDPWVAIVPSRGAAYLALGGSELLAYRSSDGGRTWSDKPVSFGHRHDHGTLGIDATDGRFGGSLYAVSHQTIRDSAGMFRSAVFVARSQDGGATFGAPTRIISSSLPAFPNNPVILSDGALVVPFVTYARSTVGEGRIELLWSIMSTDGGATFSVPRYVADCAGHWGQLAVDASAGTFRDRLYWTCWDRSNQYIYVYHSTDRGETWSPPVAANRGSGPVQSASIAVNRDGVVAISWYDGREDPREYREAFRCQHVFFSASLDGGRTFLPQVRVSSAENCPDTPANGEAGRRWTAGGDYHGLAAAADGRFHLLWADSREGIYQLRTATISVDPNVPVAR